MMGAVEDREPRRTRGASTQPSQAGEPNQPSVPGKHSEHSQGKVVRFIEGMEGGGESRFGLDPSDFDPEYLRELIGRLGLLFGERRRYFRVQVKGWENVPPSPALIISNHSGGTTILDAWGLGFAWHTHFAMKRPIHVLAHEMVFTVHQVGRMFARAGVLRAQPELGQRVLGEWKRDLLVMPGGDVDVWRPYKERYKVKFAGRTGYARLALRTGVPIVPIANAGAHETLRVLTDGAPLAKFLRFPKLFRASIFPVSLAIPWGLTIGPWPHLPTPTTLRYRIGKPVLADEFLPAPGKEPSNAQVAGYDARVRAAMQELLDGLKDEDERGKWRRGWGRAWAAE
jgi:1-acyl-sn-glycerol-3-phosphate acyltransferase